MKLNHWTLVVVFVTTLLQLETAHALFEAEATFESFYTTKGLGWAGWVVCWRCCNWRRSCGIHYRRRN